MSNQGGTDRNVNGAGTQAIRRALAVLRTFREAKTDLRLGQIANTLGLRPGTTHRIVRALVDEGYLAQDDETERCYLSRSAVLLGLAAQRTLGLSAALPLLERLGASTSESVNLGIPDGTHALVVLRVESPMPLRYDQPAGSRVPLHATAMGKALLAFGGDLDSYLDAVDGQLQKYTSHTITSVRKLRKEIEGTRSRGYSIDNEERIEGVRWVGSRSSPVRAGRGQPSPSRSRPFACPTHASTTVPAKSSGQPMRSRSCYPRLMRSEARQARTGQKRPRKALSPYRLITSAGRRNHIP